MRISQLCDEVMIALDGQPRCFAVSPVAKAIASHLKTHRINTSNVFEVIRIMWPDAVFTVRSLNDEGEIEVPAQGALHDRAHDFDPPATKVVIGYRTARAGYVSFDVEFEDGSMALVTSVNGISEEYQLIG